MKDSRKCVFCFNDLKPTDVCFENIDDTVELTRDEIKWKFKKLQNPDISPDEAEACSRQPIVRFGEQPASDFTVDEKTGFPKLWMQTNADTGFKLPNTRRICAYCHMPLPTKFGSCPNVMIGFCGNSGSGKTVYMVSLLHDLVNVDGMSVHWDAAIAPKEDDTQLMGDTASINYNQAYVAMYHGEDGEYRLPGATDLLAVLPPLVLDCMYKGKEFMLTAYDMAGEGMQHDFYMARMAQYLMNVHGVVYLKDPEYFPGFSKAVYQLDQHQYLETVFSLISAGSENRGGQPAHIAITMTKIDMLLDRYGNHPEFQKIVGKMFDGDGVAAHSKGFNVSQALFYNRKMQDLYNWSNTRDHDILALYERQKGKRPQTLEENPGCLARLFGKGKKAQTDEAGEDNVTQQAMLFGVSPLGKNANPHKSATSMYTVVDHAPNGFHNADPVLWLLFCCGVFPAARERVSDNA